MSEYKVYYGETSSGFMLLPNASMHVYSGGVVSDALLSGSMDEKEGFALAVLHVSNGGLAELIEVDAYGVVDVSSGGVASNVTVNSIGVAAISGGYVRDIEINNGATGYVSASGKAMNATVNSGGRFEVSAGATLFMGTVNSSGTIRAVGGEVSAVTVKASGKITASEGGTAYDTLVESSGDFYVGSGGTAVFGTVNGYLEVMSEGSALGVEIVSGGTMKVLDMGRADGGIVSGGTVIVSSGGYISHTLFQTGFITVSGGGMAQNTTVDKSAELWGHSGAVLADSLITGGEMLVFSSCEASGTQIESGGIVNVNMGGTATETIVSEGGLLIASSGGKVKGLSVSSGGTAIISEDVMAASVLVDAGELHVMSDGWVYKAGASGNLEMKNNGRVYVSAGGHVEGANVFDGAQAVVESDGVFTTATVMNNAAVTAQSGALVSGLTLQNRGKLIVESGGEARHINVSSGGVVTGVLREASELRFYNGELNFDIVNYSAVNEFLVDEQSFNSILADTYIGTITVGNVQTAGEYKLIEAASGFDRTLVVKNTSGTELGTVAVGGTTTISGTDYSLLLKDTGLVLTVGESSTPLPAQDVPSRLTGNQNGVSWIYGTDGTMVGVAQQFILDYSTDGFEHVFSVVTYNTEIDTLSMPAGTFQWRVKVAGGNDWAVGDDIVSRPDATSSGAKVVQSDSDGAGDIFFATPDGVWGTDFKAKHVGSLNDWSGTGERISQAGKGRIRNLFFGSTDPNVLCLTDGENGDALFVDDVYTDLPDRLREHQARLFQIQEIRAGAGDDIVDMTSQRFEYTGNGVTIRGGDGNDIIWANKGANYLFGDAGNDRIVGASGNDVIAGGAGHDSMHGGGGSDVFVFCDNWGVDTVEQLADGSVTLWFASGSRENWNAATMTYADGNNSVTVSGVAASQVTLKFGDDKTGTFMELSDMGAFDAFSSQKIFETSGTGALASL